jgi:hypothetical protein
MVRKLFCSMIVMTIAIGFVAADEFQATITKVEGDNVTFQKYKKAEKKGEKGEKDGPEVTLPVKKDVTIAKAKFNKEDKKLEVGDKIEGGLKASEFAKIGEKGVRAQITTDADNKKITQILVFPGKKKKDAN